MDNITQNTTIGRLDGQKVVIGNGNRVEHPRSPGEHAGPDTAPTIGIVAAVPDEFTALRAMLDDPASVPKSQDAADYACGTMPSRSPSDPHSVVVTLAVEAGNASAATACTNLTRSFPTVNAVMMVGIAAGVPCPREPTRHVRLGDIVVASWGIVDYDHVDMLPGGPQVRGGFPQPSPVLNRAANMLQALERRRERPWEAWLRLAERPELADFIRPPADSDVLYASDGTEAKLQHPDQARSGHRPGVPKVHYGLIGSADRSFRDGKIRDSLATRYHLRALEMEGTGIGRASFLNGLEWFVVRGVSDYGDRRTAALWRPYAALAAAAYTRALLAHSAALGPRGGHARGT